MRWTWALPGLALLALLAVLAAAPAGSAAAGLENPALLEDHAPIRIDDDAGFTAANGVRAGNGTAEDPFLIAHWRITSETQHLRIANTTKAFVVRNVQLTGQCQPVGNGTNCVYENGIYLENVAGGAVLRSVFKDLDRSGVEVERSRGIEVVENLFDGGAAGNQGTGAKFHLTQEVQVRGNVFQRQGPPEGTPLITAALRVWNSNDTVIQGNDIRGATESGLNLINVRRAVVEDNTFSGNGIGIAAQGRDAAVRYNTITDSRTYGILLNFGFLHLERNDLTFNARGLSIAAPNANATLRANNFLGSTTYGVHLLRGALADARENWWGAATGPDLNHTGPGQGELITFGVQADFEQFTFKPFLAEKASPVGAFAPRSGRTIVTGGGSGGNVGGTGGNTVPTDPAPVAVFEGPGEAFTEEEASFSAALSFDPEGGALRYGWDFGDGATAGGLRARHTWAAPGSYVVKLTVTDPTGLRGEASTEVRVTRIPFTVALRVNDTAARGEALELRASVLGAAGAVQYRFTTGGPGTFTGEPGPGNLTTVRLTEPREYLVGVEARTANETRTAFERVLVANRPPVAAFTIEPAAPTADDEVALRAGASADADGDPLTFTWDFGAGATASGANVSRRFAPGLHVIQLTVSDGFASVRDQRSLQVLPGTGGAAPPANGAPGPEAAAVLAVLGAAALLHRRRGR